MRWVPAVLVVCWTWLGCRPAAAQGLTFEWNAPASCPTHDEVLARVEHLLGRPIAATLTGPLAIAATVTERGTDSWELRLVSGDRNAEPRRVTAATCAELAEMAAVFSALSIDPTLNVGAAAAGATPADDASGPEPPADAPAPPAAPTATPPSFAEHTATPSAARPGAPRSGRKAGPLFAAFGALGLGRLPGAAGGFGVEGGVALERLGVRALLAYFPERRAAVTATSGAELALALTGVRAVYQLTEGAAQLGLSAGVTLGWMHGGGTGVARPASGDALLLAFEPGARAGYALTSSWALVVDAGLPLHVNRPRFVLAGSDAYRPPVVGAQFGLGVEWRPW